MTPVTATSGARPHAIVVAVLWANIYGPTCALISLTSYFSSTDEILREPTSARPTEPRVIKVLDQEHSDLRMQNYNQYQRRPGAFAPQLSDASDVDQQARYQRGHPARAHQFPGGQDAQNGARPFAGLGQNGRRRLAQVLLQDPAISEQGLRNMMLQRANHERRQGAPTAIPRFNTDPNLPAFEPLVIFPPPPYTSPVTSVVPTGFRIFAFAGPVTSLVSPTSPAAAWLAPRTTTASLADRALLDDILADFVHQTHADCPAPSPRHKAAALLFLMLYKPPRAGEPFSDREGWHRDPAPWPHMDGHVPARYTLTLLGEGTRVLDAAGAPQPALARAMPRVFGAAERSMAEGQVVRFTMGRVDSPVHSAPKIVRDRVFVNVVFGTEEEVRANRRGIPWRDAAAVAVGEEIGVDSYYAEDLKEN